MRLPESAIVCPLVTPLTADGVLDPIALGRLLDAVGPEVDALMVLGTTGELATLRSEIADQAAQAVITAGTGRPVIIGVGAAGTDQAINNLDRARGAAAVALCAPYYVDVADDELARHYTAVADAAELPLLLYNIPQHTHRALSPGLVAELSRHPSIIGIKDSGPDRASFAAFAALRGPDFTVLRGTDEGRLHDYLDDGVDGFVAGLENIVPGLMRRLVRRRRADSTGLEVLRELIALVNGHGGVRAIKALSAARFGGSGTPVPPLLPLPPETVASLIDRLDQLLARLT